MKPDANRILDINIVEIDNLPNSLPMEFMDDFIRIIEAVIESKNKWLSVSQSADASLIFKVHRNSQNSFSCEVYFVYKNDKEHTKRYWLRYVILPFKSNF